MIVVSLAVAFARPPMSMGLVLSSAAARLVAVLEPLLIVVMAVLVGFIAFATILPILEMSNVCDPFARTRRRSRKNGRQDVGTVPTVC